MRAVKRRRVSRPSPWFLSLCCMLFGEFDFGWAKGSLQVERRHCAICHCGDALKSEVLIREGESARTGEQEEDARKMREILGDSEGL